MFEFKGFIMFELKTWDTQLRVAVEIGRELCKVEGITRIEVGKVNTPYITCEYGGVYITIHIYKKVFQIQLTGTHKDLKVFYHTWGNATLGIVDKLQSMLPPQDLIKSIKE